MTTGLTKNQLVDLRGDLSPFLIHLTRTGDLKLSKDIHSLMKDTVVQLDAKQSLDSILKSKRIEAKSAFGYFNYKVPYKRYNGTTANPRSYVRRDWLRGVCFSETPIENIHIHMKPKLGGNQYRPYGLAFFEKIVRAKNGNPIFYVQTTNQPIRNSLDQIALDPLAIQFKDTMPFIEGFGPPWFPNFTSPSEIDFRWEREWRIAGDFSFSLSDIAFGICETSDIAYFESLVGNLFPFIDPTKDLAQEKTKMKKFNHLKDIK